MKLNIVLLTVAAALIALVTYRMGLIQLNRRFCLDLLPNLALAVVLMVALYFWAGGMHGVKLGALAGVKVTLKFVPLLVVVFWAVGEASLLIEMHKEWVREALGGKYGLIGAFLAAMVMPSGMTGLPIVADLWDKGADKKVLITFIVVSSLIGMQIVLFRQPILGWEITGVYLAFGFILSVVFTLGVGLWRPKV